MLLLVPISLRAAEPAEQTGSLVIVGGGRIPDSVREKFVNLAGGAKAKLVIIPTASESADKPAEETSYLEPWRKLKPANIVLLHTRDRKVADSDDFLKPLADATGVWFGGGDQSRVTDAYLGTKAETAFRKVLERGGVLGGTSAGAALMSNPMITGGNPVATFGKGFGFLPGFITDQHFLKRERQPRLKGMLEKHPGLIGVGIDEATAIVVTGRRLEVLGESTATLYLAPGGGRPWFEQSLKNKEFADTIQLYRAAKNRAAKEPFPPAVPGKPVVAKGSLVILGGAMTNEIADKVLDLAGGKDALIVLVTPDIGKMDITNNNFRSRGATNQKAITIRNRKEADDPDFSKVLLDAKAVWLIWQPSQYVDFFENTLILKRFHEVLARGGVIGGNNIIGDYMLRGYPLNSIVSTEGYERGFGFLPGCAVDEEFFTRERENDMKALMKKYPQYLGIGLDDSTAIVVQGSVAEVIGKSKVAFFDKEVPLEAKPGQKYDLAKRKLVE